MSAYNFIRSGLNFTKYFCSRPKGSLSSRQFRFCRYLYRFQRYLRSNSKVVVNRAIFARFLPSQILRGRCPQI